ncbi:DUF2971 domain-containing protein [Crassaminicella indica]|uniref:DUF2971 domain-containing protein n=1 Tax=Crassaminicella indica TaxID=2855394 RepID=A0ABX8RD54_9CLOT|nr:DUF2971 domain-containing protein [Crassaminicella indica]QXM06963.1 DUF2971 domain-containing protein [Crassaminicella indica]
MVKFFYKYTRLREDFFRDFMLRATPFKALNDPFEGIFNEKQFKDANNSLNAYFTKQGNIVDKLEDYELDGIMGTLQSDFDDVGVLSFTEDYTNPLMWAHYADQYKGIVLEFDSEKPLFQDSIKFLGNRKSRFGKPYLGHIYEFPEKVMYRREMPSFDRPEQLQPNSDGEYHWIKFLYSLFFTKSNDWIYEKELRSIVQLRDADRIICTKDNHLIDVLSKCPEIRTEDLADGKIQITYPNEYEMHENMGDESIKAEIYMHTSSFNSSSIHLFRINPKAISGIYCGCKCNYKKVQMLVKRNKQLAHLEKSIYKMEVDSHQYQLNRKPINI